MDDMPKEMQRSYWDKLSDRYQRSMKITQDDFHYGPQIPGESTLHLLPEIRPGMTALELGCGGAQNSLWLAKQGVRCSACDISSKQLAHAQKYAQEANVKIKFACTPIESFTEEFKESYDLIHSSHAFEFINNPQKVIRDCAAQLNPGGMLLISTVHPLYNGEWVDNIDEDGNPDGMGLFLTNYFNPPDDIRYVRGKIDVISRAYPVSAWFNWFRAAKLEVCAIAEPPALPEGIRPPYTNKDWANTEGELDAIPGTLIIAGTLSASK